MNDTFRTVFAVQQLLEAKLQSFLALVIDGGESHDMPRHLARGVVTTVLAQQVHAGDSQSFDVGGLLRRHVAFQVQEFAVEVAGDAAGQGLLVFLERLAELRQLIDVFVKFLGVDPDTVHRRAHRQRFAVAIGDRAAVCCDFHHPHGTIVALLGEKSVIEQLQFDGARGQADRAQHHQA